MTRMTFFALLLFAATELFAQREQTQAVLSVVIDGWGVGWPQGRHNYLTVLQEGNVIYLHRAKRGLTAQITDKISQKEIDELRMAIAEVAALRQQQVGPREAIDYRLTVEIKAEPELVLKISHYDVDQPISVPKPVYRLLCLVDSFRDEAYRITKRAECGK